MTLKCRKAELGTSRYSREPPPLVETCHGNLSSLSFAKIRAASPTCFRWFEQAMPVDGLREFAHQGRTMPISKTITAITAITSMSVSALNCLFVQLAFIQACAGTKADSRTLSKKFLLALDSLARFRHQFRARFGFFEAREADWKTRLPQLVHALQQSCHHRRTGRLPAPEQ